MKKLISLTCLLIACSLPFSAQSLEFSVKPEVTEIKAPHSYMFVGNSYTYYSGGLVSVVNGLTKAAGIKVRRSRMVTIGGAGLGWFNVWELVRPSGMAAHYVDKNDGGKIKEFDFRKEKVFDAVVLQDNSTGLLKAQRKASVRKHIKQHSYDLQCIGIQPLVLMTWAPKKNPEMIRQLADATTKIGNESDAMVIPVGLAFAEAAKRDSKINLYREDNTHPSAEGTYLEGCVVFASMYRTSPVGLKYYGVEKVDPKTALFLQEVAWDTVCEYFGWKK